ncbi:MAG: hypothetical protein IIB56_06990 [Planctomycetes bacterium]|nr:hypothetical protein [Planctomycetota bacterium]MCH8118208.1 hypothetical protein [Planctomycetota bacterium]
MLQYYSAIPRNLKPFVWPPRYGIRLGRIVKSSLDSYFVVYDHFTSPCSHTAATVGRVTSHGKALDFILNDGIIFEQL